MSEPCPLHALILLAFASPSAPSLAGGWEVLGTVDASPSLELPACSLALQAVMSAPPPAVRVEVHANAGYAVLLLCKVREGAPLQFVPQSSATTTLCVRLISRI